jgi:hypothetical protein
VISQGHVVALNLVRRELAGPWIWGLKNDAKIGAKKWKWKRRVRRCGMWLVSRQVWRLRPVPRIESRCCDKAFDAGRLVL